MWVQTSSQYAVVRTGVYSSFVESALFMDLSVRALMSAIVVDILTEYNKVSRSRVRVRKECQDRCTTMSFTLLTFLRFGYTCL